MPNNLTTRTESLLDVCDKATPGPLRATPLLTSVDSSWSIVTGNEANPDQIADVFGQINWGEGGRQDAQCTAKMLVRLHNEAPALLRDLLARVAFLEAALEEAKTFFYEDKEWIKHRGYDCEPGTMPNLAKWLQEGEMISEIEKRKAYIRASDKRVFKWPEAKQEAFASSVNRMAGACAPVVTEPTQTDLQAQVASASAVIQGFLNEIPPCSCHPAFTDRGLDDPSCYRCYFADQIAAAEKWLQEGE